MRLPYTNSIIKHSLLTLVMMAGTMAAMAQDVAKIDETGYQSLKAAVEAATDGQTVTLVASTSETETYSIADKKITIDFADYTVTASHNNGSAIVFNISSTGGLTLTGTTGGFTDDMVKGIFYNQGVLTVEGGVYSTTVDDYGVIFNEGGECNVSGGTLTGAYAAIYAKGTNRVDVTDGSINGAYIGIQANAGTTLNVTGGTITATNEAKKYPGLYLVGEGTNVTVSGGNISGWDGISVRQNASLTVEDGAIVSARNAAIIGNGNPDQGNTIVIINGGTMTSEDTGIYHPQTGGQLTINGGSITGVKLGVEIRAGELSVTGGSITATTDTYSCIANTNGTTTTGAALAIAQHTTKQNISVTIEGGTFNGVKAINESNPQENDPAPQVTMSVTDGTFKGDIAVVDVQNGFISGGTYSNLIPKEYCSEGFSLVVNTDGTYSVGSTTDVETEAEAMINDLYYKVIADAIAAAGTEQTKITVLKDPAAESVIIPVGADITLAVANEVTLSKPVTVNGKLTVESGKVSTVTIAVVDATVKVKTGVALPTVALSEGLLNVYVLKANTTKVVGFMTYWACEKVSTAVELTELEPTPEQEAAAEALAGNASVLEVTGLAANQSMTMTVTSVTLTAGKVTEATFDVKLFDADDQEKTGDVDPAITFRLPIHSTVSEGTWVNIWHDEEAIEGMNVIGAENRYVTVTATSFSPYSYEIIETPIAQIGKTKYATVADAIAKATAEETVIKLLGDVSEAISVTSGKNVRLSVGEFTVSGNISNEGTLTITDGTFTGSITNTDPGIVAISGGTHTVLPVAAYCAAGYMPVMNDAEKYNMISEWAITDATAMDAHFAHLTAGAGYKVATASYYRNTGMVSAGNANTRYGTVCLPFDIKSDVDGMTLYRATSIEGSTLTISAVDFPVKAGTPLIFELSAEASNMTVTSKDEVNAVAVNTEAPAEAPAADNLLVGTYAQKVINDVLANIFYLNGDKFHKAALSLTVPAYRAYLDTRTAPAGDSRMLSIIKDGDDTTGIEEIDAFGTVTKVYDLNGRKLNCLQRGVNIMRRADGSTVKVIVK